VPREAQLLGYAEPRNIRLKHEVHNRGLRRRKISGLVDTNILELELGSIQKAPLVRRNLAPQANGLTHKGADLSTPNTALEGLTGNITLLLQTGKRVTVGPEAKAGKGTDHIPGRKLTNVIIRSNRAKSPSIGIVKRDRGNRETGLKTSLHLARNKELRIRTPDLPDLEMLKTLLPDRPQASETDGIKSRRSININEALRNRLKDLLLQSGLNKPYPPLGTGLGNLLRKRRKLARLRINPLDIARGNLATGIEDPPAVVRNGRRNRTILLTPQRHKIIRRRRGPNRSRTTSRRSKLLKRLNSTITPTKAGTSKRPLPDATLTLSRPSQKHQP